MVVAALIAAALGQNMPIMQDELRLLHSGFRFTEGPVAGTDHDLYFSDIPANRIYRLDGRGELHIFLEDTGGANGLAIRGNRLIACQGNLGQIGEFDLRSKRHRVLAATYNGQRFNAPNDLVFDRVGGFYFTDPHFSGNAYQDQQGVYYVRPNGEATRVIDDLKWPNGIAFSPDWRTLYVLPTGDPYLRAYPVLGPGRLGEPLRLFRIPTAESDYLRGGDGLAVDERGNLYLTVPALKQVMIISPSGERLLEIPVPEGPTNVAFGGPDRRTLYITAGSGLYAVRMNLAGVSLTR